MNKKQQRKRRHARVRAKIKGTARVPRLSVFKSNKHIYAELIDDENKNTLAASSDKNVKDTAGKQPKEKAKLVGHAIAKKALEQKIKHVVFDRGGFRYTGNVQSLSEGAREGGLLF